MTFLYVLRFLSRARKRRVSTCLAIFRHLVEFWVPFWRPLNFEGVPKSTSCWILIFEIIRKLCPKGGFEKTWFVDWFLMPKWETWTCKKRGCRIILVADKKIWAVRKIDRKEMSKWHQKGIKSKAFGVQGLICSDLDGFGQAWFFDVLGGWPKTAKK